MKIKDFCRKCGKYTYVGEFSWLCFECLDDRWVDGVRKKFKIKMMDKQRYLEDDDEMYYEPDWVTTLKKYWFWYAIMITCGIYFLIVLVLK